MCNALSTQRQPFFTGIVVRGPVAPNFMPQRELAGIAEEYNLRFPSADGLAPSASLEKIQAAIQMATDQEFPWWVQTRTHGWSVLEVLLLQDDSNLQ